MTQFARRESQHLRADGTSKVTYEDRNEAKAVAKKMRRRACGKHYNVYLCPECNKYHIGGRPRGDES